MAVKIPIMHTVVHHLHHPYIKCFWSRGFHRPDTLPVRKQGKISEGISHKIILLQNINILFWETALLGL